MVSTLFDSFLYRFCRSDLNDQLFDHSRRWSILLQALEGHIYYCATAEGRKNFLGRLFSLRQRWDTRFGSTGASRGALNTYKGSDWLFRAIIPPLTHWERFFLTLAFPSALTLGT